VTLALADRVLVKDQGSGGVENGIYVAGAAPSRAPDFDDDDEVLGAVVYVIDGTANAGTAWAVTNTAATIVDTDGIAWAAFGGGGGGLTVADEGVPLATLATTLDFVGAGVMASGTGATKTITIPGAGGGDITGQLGAGFDAGTSALTVGKVVYVVAPYTGTITGWVVLGNTTGNASFDVAAVAAGGSLPAFPGDSIVAAAPPSMTGAVQAASAAVGTWTVAVTAGHIYAFKLATVSGLSWASVTLTYSRP
jgi:hypothetical protein